MNRKSKYIISVVLIVLFSLGLCAVSESACTRNYPSVHFSPITGTVVGASTAKIYTVTVTNTDKEDTPGECGPSTFTLSISPAEVNPGSFVVPSTLGAVSTGSLAVGGRYNTTITVTTTGSITEGQMLTSIVQAADGTGHAGKTGTGSVVSTASNAKGDGSLLKRDVEETCHSCHKTDRNRTPSDPDWDEAIKMHNSAALGSSKWSASGGWGVAGGKYGEFRCTTCHTPHDTANIYLIKETITTPDGTNFQGRGTNSVSVDFRVKSGTPANPGPQTPGIMGDDTVTHSSSVFICEVCHTYDNTQANGVNKHAYNMSVTTTHNNATDCVSCHSHQNSFTGGGCTGCHGNPPMTATIGGPDGLATPATGATSPLSAGAHDLHANTRSMGCDACHTGGMPASAIPSNSIHFGFTLNGTNVPNFSGSITTGTISNAFAPLNVPYTGYVAAAGTTVNTNSNHTFNCTIYCHGATMDVAGDMNGGTNISPSWVGGSTEASCGTCHGTDNTNPPLRGSHEAHLLGTTIPCSDCHNGYVPPAATTSHVDNLSEFAFDTGKSYLTGASYSGDTTMMNTYGSCSNVACHGTGVDAVSPQWGTDVGCTDCHRATTLGDLRKVAGSNGDFVRLSRHVSGGTATEIVTSYDCIVCHMEGDHTSSSADIKIDRNNHPLAPTASNIVNLRDVDSYNGTSFTGWAIDKTAWDETQRANFDAFCLNCHDVDGARTITVNASNDGLDVGTTDRTRRLTPFNTNDNLRNGRDGFGTTNSPARSRIVDVKSQFFAGSGGSGTGYNGNPSQHAVLGARYSTVHGDTAGLNWVSGAWTSHTLRNTGQAGSGVMNVTRERATLHCSDCHLSETNAHGATNAWHMLLDGVLNNYTNDTAMGGLQLSSNTSINICYKCHIDTVYRGDNSVVIGPSRFNHDQDGDWFDADYGTGGGNEAYLGSPCLNCHSGDGFGHIHGRGSATDSDNTTYTPNGTSSVYTKYRFMPGGWMQYNPSATTSGTDTAWTTASPSGRSCYFPSSSNWSDCTSHSNGSRNAVSNYGRPVRY